MEADTIIATLLLVPITVLSISSWTRFLAPGTGFSSPNLGCSLSFHPTPTLSLFVIHKTETFRISVLIVPNTISDLHAAANPALNAHAVAVRFNLAPGSARYARWEERENGECWRVVGDFTGGEADTGERFELTGNREVRLPCAFQMQADLNQRSSCRRLPKSKTSSPVPFPPHSPLNPPPRFLRLGGSPARQLPSPLSSSRYEREGSTTNANAASPRRTRSPRK